jgi:hypothetical protein
MAGEIDRRKKTTQPSLMNGTARLVVASLTEVRPGPHGDGEGAAGRGVSGEGEGKTLRVVGAVGS